MTDPGLPHRPADLDVARHRLRVANVVDEAPGVVSLYLTGRELQRLDVRAGQYFLWRFLTPDGWWHSHPYSISAAPNGDWLRITVKDLGDGSRDLHSRPDRHAGDRRGTLRHPDRRPSGPSRAWLLIAGGIGITPLRALVEALPGRPGDITLLYRASRPADLVFCDELDVLARRRGIDVHYLVGQRGSPADATRSARRPRARHARPRHPRPRRVRLRPGIDDAVTEAALRTLGVPRRQIHAERFAY